MKIRYPEPLKPGDAIAVTAPSSGVAEALHERLELSRAALEKRGFTVIEGQALRSDDKCVSASAAVRAEELQRFLADERIGAIIPPWGGEFLMELLPLIDWDRLRHLPPKWVLGYSDISTFTFAYTLLTGHASAHGTNYIDMSGDPPDPVTSMWMEVLGTRTGESVRQVSSERYQSAWDFTTPGFRLDTPTRWKALGHEQNEGYESRITGRLIGGGLDTLSILLGTPYAPVERFAAEAAADTGLVWYLESCEMDAADLYRHLWQMKACGCFGNTNGVLIGRPASYKPKENFGLTDALHRVFDDLGIPVLYDVDIGHVPPQLTLVNGAYAEIDYRNGTGGVVMTYR